MTSRAKRNLRAVLRTFSKEDIFKEILPIFPSVTAEDLTSQIRHLKYKTNPASLADVLIDLLKENDIPDSELEEKVPLCRLKSVVKNSSKKLWTCFTLLGPPDAGQGPYTADDVNAAIRHEFLQNNVHAMVTTILADSMYCTEVVEKKLLKTKRLEIKKPYYIARFLDEPFLFTTKKDVSRPVLESFCEAFRFKDWKLTNLNGYDLESMLKHLLHKGHRKGPAPPAPAFNTCEETAIGKNYTQHHKRRQYITDMMGPSPPKLSNYVVVAKNIPWRGRLSKPKFQGSTHDVKIEFRTSDTVEFLKDLAEEGILQIPPPSYVANLLSTGRNKINLKVQAGVPGASETETQTDAGF